MAVLKRLFAANLDCMEGLMVSFLPHPKMDAMRNFPQLEVVLEQAGGPPIVERGRFGFDTATFYLISSRRSKLYTTLGAEPIPVCVTPIDSRGQAAGETLECEAKIWRDGMLYDGALTELRRKYWMFWWQTLFRHIIAISIRGHARWREAARHVDLNALILATPSLPAELTGKRCENCSTEKASGHRFCSDCGATL